MKNQKLKRYVMRSLIVVSNLKFNYKSPFGHLKPTFCDKSTFVIGENKEIKQIAKNVIEFCKKKKINAKIYVTKNEVNYLPMDSLHKLSGNYLFLSKNFYYYFVKLSNGEIKNSIEVDNDHTKLS